MVKYLEHFDFPVRVRWKLVGEVCLAVAAAIAAGLASRYAGLHPIPAIVLAYLVYAGGIWISMPFTDEELDLGKQMFLKRKRANAD